MHYQGLDHFYFQGLDHFYFQGLNHFYFPGWITSTSLVNLTGFKPQQLGIFRNDTKGRRTLRRHRPVARQTTPHITRLLQDP